MKLCQFPRRLVQRAQGLALDTAVSLGGPRVLRWSHLRCLRRRVAHHEAAHAVLASAYGLLLPSFTVDETFLNAPGGVLGGFTGWNAPNGGGQIDIASARVTVFLAGQCAEQHLAHLDESVRVPDHDPGWDDDDRFAATELNGPLLGNDPGAPARLREATRGLITTHWRAISALASELDRLPIPKQGVPVSPPRDPRPFAPASRIVSGGEVRRHVLNGLIAERAVEQWRAREWPRLGARQDWLAAEREVARSSPGITERWLFEANDGLPRWRARFEFESAARANVAITTFRNTAGVVAQSHGSPTMVLVEFSPSEYSAVATMGRTLRGEFVR